MFASPSRKSRDSNACIMVGDSSAHTPVSSCIHNPSHHPPMWAWPICEIPFFTHGKVADTFVAPSDGMGNVFPDPAKKHKCNNAICKCLGFLSAKACSTVKKRLCTYACWKKRYLKGTCSASSLGIRWLRYCVFLGPSKYMSELLQVWDASASRKGSSNAWENSLAEKTFLPAMEKSVTVTLMTITTNWIHVLLSQEGGEKNRPDIGHSSALKKFIIRERIPSYSSLPFLNVPSMFHVAMGLSFCKKVGEVFVRNRNSFCHTSVSPGLTMSITAWPLVILPFQGLGTHKPNKSNITYKNKVWTEAWRKLANKGWNDVCILYDAAGQKENTWNKLKPVEEQHLYLPQVLNSTPCSARCRQPGIAHSAGDESVAAQ